MPVTASYQSCFFDVFSQRKQKNHAPQKKGVIWVQGHALLCTIYVQSIGAVSIFFTQKSRGGKCPSRQVIKVVSLTCFRGGNKKTALLNVRRNMVQGHALLCTIYIQSIGAVSWFVTQKSRGGKCPSRRVTGAANRA